MKECRYCKREGKFEPSLRQVLCNEHKKISLERYLGRNCDTPTPEGVLCEEYLQ